MIGHLGISYSQIKIITTSSSLNKNDESNIVVIGKIKISNTNASSFFRPKIKIADGLKSFSNTDLNKHFKKRKETNSVYSNLKTSTTIFGDLSSSLVYFKNKEKYLLTFLNRKYDYQNESIWISEESKEALYQLIKKELSKKEKFKDIEIIIDEEIVLVLSMHKRKVNFNLWGGDKWYCSSWYRIGKINNLFGK